MAKPEKVLIENSSLKDIFTKEFLKKLEASGKNIFPINVVFIHEFDKDGKKHAFSVILNHQNADEVKNNKLHVESMDEDLLEIFIDILEKKENDKK